MCSENHKNNPLKDKTHCLSFFKKQCRILKSTCTFRAIVILMVSGKKDIFQGCFTLLYCFQTARIKHLLLHFSENHRGLKQILLTENSEKGSSLWFQSTVRAQTTFWMWLKQIHKINYLMYQYVNDSVFCMLTWLNKRKTY